MPNPTRIQKLEAAEKDNKRRQQERRRDLKLQLADHVLKAIEKDPDLQRKAAALVAALAADDRDELQHAFPRLKPRAEKTPAPATPGKSPQRADAAHPRTAPTPARLDATKPKTAHPHPSTG